jgi:acyl-coenzyme A synthetase/AMP-(fatty) acid ligase
MRGSARAETPRRGFSSASALVAARALGWPGERISAEPLNAAAARALRVTTSLEALRQLGEGRPVPPTPADADPAAVVFTSGATGPAKGVSYRHHQLQAQRDVLARVYEIADDDRFVAAFAPFALYGPAMGVPSVVPDMSVTEPGTLRATALADAVEAIGATLVFASPAALRNVVATAGDLTPRQREALARVRMVLSAGAPVPPRRAARRLPRSCRARRPTPYGMTGSVAGIRRPPAGIDAAGAGTGVCVGVPCLRCRLRSARSTISMSRGRAHASRRTSRVKYASAPHVKDSYDNLWFTQPRASSPRTGTSGDVRPLRRDGRLWIEGRMIHIITTADGPVTPVGIEQAVESVGGIGLAAAVGVGPIGTQQVIVVVVPTDRPTRPDLAPEALAARVREVVGVDVAAVFEVPALPVDKRHNSKIDRTRVSKWAGAALAGRRIRKL